MSGTSEQLEKHFQKKPGILKHTQIHTHTHSHTQTWWGAALRVKK